MKVRSLIGWTIFVLVSTFETPRESFACPFFECSGGKSESEYGIDFQQSALDKRRQMTALIDLSRFGDDLPEDPTYLSRFYNNILDVVSLFTPSFRTEMFDDSAAADQGAPRRKGTHRLSGVTAWVRMDASRANTESSPNPFTGIFKEGAKHVLLRMSNAPSIKDAPFPLAGAAPSLAFKILRDFAPPGEGVIANGTSLNLAVISRLQPLDNNANTFFSAPFNNNLKFNGSNPLITQFNRTADSLNSEPGKPQMDPHMKLTGLYLPLRAFAITNERSEKIEAPHIPYMVEFRPTQQLAEMEGLKSSEDFRLPILRELSAPDTVLFHVYAWDKDGPEVHVFDVVTESGFTASDFGNKVKMPHNRGWFRDEVSIDSGI